MCHLKVTNAFIVYQYSVNSTLHVLARKGHLSSGFICKAKYVFFLWPKCQTGTQAASSLRFLDRTHTYVRGRAPMNELPACRRGRYLNNTQATQGQTSMTSAGFETAIPAVELLQIYAFDRPATGIDALLLNVSIV